jgi:hypothetical protein
MVSTGEFSSRAPTFATLDGQGRIVVAGYQVGPAQPIAVARFTPDGMPDTTFGTAGLALIDFGLTNGTGPSGASAYGVALDADGRIVISAQVGPVSDGSVGVARLWP